MAGVQKMENMQKRYERKGKAKPCFLTHADLLALAQIIQESFTRPEVERFFRVSTTLGSTRVFTNSIDDFVEQPELSEKVYDLSFWIEGWDQKNRFDKNILLDFSRYSIQLSVEGTDPVWVYDKYTKIMRFLEHKTAWYWPIIILEKFITFIITIVLISSIIISFSAGVMGYYTGKIALLGIWSFLIFYDTRKIWPYSNIRLKGTESALSKENVFMATIFALLLFAVFQTTILPLLK